MIVCEGEVVEMNKKLGEKQKMEQEAANEPRSRLRTNRGVANKSGREE